jgi:hypothetical protein
MTVDQLQALRDALVRRIASGIVEIHSPAAGTERFQTTKDLAVALTTLDSEIQKQQSIDSGGATTTTNVSIGTTTR